MLAEKMPPSVRIVSASCEGGLCPKIRLYRPTSVRLPSPIASLPSASASARSYRTSIFPSMATLLPLLEKKQILPNASEFQWCASKSYMILASQTAATHTF